MKNQCHKKNRRGSISLEVVLTLGVTLMIAIVGFQMARTGYRALHFVISSWTGSPFF